MTDNEKLKKINLALFGKEDVDLDITLDKIDYLKKHMNQLESSARHLYGH